MVHIKNPSKTLEKCDRYKIIPRAGGNEFILIFRTEKYQKGWIYISLKEMENGRIEAKFFYPNCFKNYFDSFDELLATLYSLEL